MLFTGKTSGVNNFFTFFAPVNLNYMYNPSHITKSIFKEIDTL